MPGPPGLRLFVAAHEQTIFSRRCNGPHGAFHTVGIELDASVFKKPFQSIPMVERMTDRFGGWSARGQFRYPRSEPDGRFRDQRFTLTLARGQPLSGTLAANSFLDLIER